MNPIRSIAILVAPILMAVRTAILILPILLAAPAALAKPALPTTDKAGSADSPIVKRYDQSIILEYEHKSFDELTLPLSKLEVEAQKSNAFNEIVYEPKQKKVVEGDRTRLTYLIPNGVSPLEVVRNYEDEIKRKGGKILYQCKSPDCGGEPSRNVLCCGARMGLSDYLLSQARVTDPEKSLGWCLSRSPVNATRYMVGELPAEGAHVSVMAYSLSSAPYCEGFQLEGRTFATVDVVASKDIQNKMVTVRAADMAEAITSKGKVALYGIYFDSDRADVKPTSDATIEQVGKLLKENPKLKLLVVGHTDNAGTFPANMELSQRRAAAVVNALATRYGVKKDRLTPVGVSFAVPVDSNRTDAGRAKNRRVELVEN